MDGRVVEPDLSGTTGLRPTTTVLGYLRSLPSRKGTREGCAEGDCGACTVVIAEPGNDGRLAYRTVDSCLVFLPMIHGKQLITVEDLAFPEGGQKILHPVQKLLADANGSQCGYCTPGMILTAKSLLDHNPRAAESEVRIALSGNLCRCTGYQKIVEAVLFAGRISP